MYLFACSNWWFWWCGKRRPYKETSILNQFCEDNSNTNLVMNKLVRCGANAVLALHAQCQFSRHTINLFYSIRTFFCQSTTWDKQRQHEFWCLYCLFIYLCLLHFNLACLILSNQGFTQMHLPMNALQRHSLNIKTEDKVCCLFYPFPLGKQELWQWAAASREWSWVIFKGWKNFQTAAVYFLAWKWKDGNWWSTNE